MPQAVGLDGHPIWIEGVVVSLRVVLGRLRWAWKAAQGEEGDPLAWAWGDLLGSCLCVFVDRDPVLFAPLQICALVWAQAIGSAHPEGPTPMGKLDLLHGCFDLPVLGDFALGACRLRNHGRRPVVVRSRGRWTGDLCKEVALVPAACRALGHQFDCLEQEPFVDRTGVWQLAQSL